MQIIYEAESSNQQLLYKEDTEVFYYRDLESGDILYIPPVLQEFLKFNCVYRKNIKALKDLN